MILKFNKQDIRTCEVNMYDLFEIIDKYDYNPNDTKNPFFYENTIQKINKILKPMDIIVKYYEKNHSNNFLVFKCNSELLRPISQYQITCFKDFNLYLYNKNYKDASHEFTKFIYDFGNGQIKRIVGISEYYMLMQMINSYLLSCQNFATI